MLAQREIAPGERRQDLCRHPDRRREVTAAVAVAPVRAPQACEVAVCGGAGLAARGEERLDRPGGRLGIRAATGDELEAAVAVLEAAEECEPASDRPPRHSRGTQPFDDGG